jgi:asparagine synthase (glutamine-hydrolysing)
LYRYLAFVWNAPDLTKRDAIAALVGRLGNEWQSVASAPGVQVLQSGERKGSSGCLRLAHGSGVVLGTLFRKARAGLGPSTKAKIDDRESALIVDSRGQHLLDSYWGRYVAVLYDSEKSIVSILREPSGALPCLMTSYRGVDIIFSDVESVAQLGLPPFSINWKYIAGIACSRGLQLRDTGLKEVSEVQPGERIDLHGGAYTRSLLWNPLRISQTDRIENVEEAVAAVRHTTRDCVHAFASCYDSILHRLSGGLDSSIVASCLSDVPTHPKVVCLNYFGHGAHEDERPFARSVAQLAGLPLIEEEHDPTGVRIEALLHIVRSERPRFLIYHVEHSELEARIAKTVSASAFFGGAGGDGLFYQNTAYLAAVDYIYAHGMAPHLWHVALDAARMDRVSIWSVLRRAVSEAMLDRRWDPTEEIGAGSMFVNPDIARSLKGDKSLAHPWLEDAAGVPHGKLWHAMSVSNPLPFYDPLGREDDPENVYPLISQPLLELCMRIPVYSLIDGGWDRAIARRAFADSLPTEIVRRRAKGGSTRSAKLLFEKNMPFIREFMLNGLLVRERILDRKKLETHLTPGRPVSGSAFGEILIEHLCTEAWLRSWNRPIAVASVA